MIHLQIFQQQVLPAKDKLFRLSLRMLENAEDARDVVQEVMLRVWKNREEMEQYRNIEAWCMQIAKNLCLDRLKARKIRYRAREEIKRQGGTEDPPTPYQQAASRQYHDQLRGVIGRMPEKYRLVLHLRDIEGFSYKEITVITGQGMDELKVNLFRARKALKEQLLKMNVYGIP